MPKLPAHLLSASMCMLVAACSGASSTPETNGTDDPLAGASGANTPAGAKAPAKGASSPGATPAPAPAPAPPAADPNAPGTAGQPGRISVDEHCCYGAKYFRCPSTAACFGGFDIDACEAKCKDADDACFDACGAAADAAGAPKGCDATVAPPAGVDCANGAIDL